MKYNIEIVTNYLAEFLGFEADAVGMTSSEVKGVPIALAANYAFYNVALLEQSVNDALLLDDVENERMVMDQVFDKLRELNQPVAHWYYGHFHQSWHSSIDGVLFKMLDIIELTELRS